MEAPDKIYLPSEINMLCAAILKAQNAADDIEYIRKDALLKWLKKEYETISWYYEKMKHVTGCAGDTSSSGKAEAYKKIIEKIESL